MAVRVVFFGHFPKGPFDFFGGGSPTDTQNLIMVGSGFNIVQDICQIETQLRCDSSINLQRRIMHMKGFSYGLVHQWWQGFAIHKLDNAGQLQGTGCAQNLFLRNSTDCQQVIETKRSIQARDNIAFLGLQVDSLK